MNVLVVNIGSTSFKFRLIDMADERVLARGGVEDVGKPVSQVTFGLGETRANVGQRPVADQAEAIRVCLEALASAESGRALAIDAVGFKAVHGGQLADAVRVTPEVLGVMESFAEAAPAHNPAYVAAMKTFAQQMPDTPLVAAFETGFHQTIAEARHTYAVPYEWKKAYGVRRYGFHGASHRYIASRVAELLGRRDLRIISYHLGGSSSICAIRDGRSIANSFGMTPQSGLPQNNRVGDFDAYALLMLRARTGLQFEELLVRLASGGGLLGISGISNDMQEIVTAAQAGNPRAELALNVFVESVRDYIGAYLVALGGLDVLVFTGGIGAGSAEVRRRICDGLQFLGIRLDSQRNERGGSEATLSADDSPVRILAMQTNEELIVARQTRDVLTR
jgi:acetate kinase